MLPASKITIINILQRIGTLWRTASHASPQLGLGSSWPASVGARSTNRQCHVEGSAIHHPAALLSAGGWTQICFHYHYVLIYRTIYDIKLKKKNIPPNTSPYPKWMAVLGLQGSFRACSSGEVLGGKVETWRGVAPHMWKTYVWLDIILLMLGPWISKHCFLGHESSAARFM